MSALTSPSVVPIHSRRIGSSRWIAGVTTTFGGGGAGAFAREQAKAARGRTRTRRRLVMRLLLRRERGRRGKIDGGTPGGGRGAGGRGAWDGGMHCDHEQVRGFVVGAPQEGVRSRARNDAGRNVPREGVEAGDHPAEALARLFEKSGPVGRGNEAVPAYLRQILNGVDDDELTLLE